MNKKTKVVKVKDLEDPDKATNIQLAVGALALITGCVTTTTPDELALTCHRLAPGNLGWPEYGHLPKFDLLRITLLDIRRAGFIPEGAQRISRDRRPLCLTKEGKAWVKRNQKFIEALSKRVPDPKAYSSISDSELVECALHSAQLQKRGLGIDRNRLVAEAYRLFPSRFSLEHYPGWPDAGQIDRAIAQSKAITKKAIFLSLRTAQKRNVAKTYQAMRLGTKTFGSTHRVETDRVTARAIKEVESSALYKKSQINSSEVGFDEDDICDLLQVTLDAQPDTIRHHLETLSELINRGERHDLSQFLIQFYF